jgi:hypothetical protein
MGGVWDGEKGMEREERERRYGVCEKGVTTSVL